MYVVNIEISPEFFGQRSQEKLSEKGETDRFTWNIIRKKNEIANVRPLIYILTVAFPFLDAAPIRELIEVKPLFVMYSVHIDWSCSDVWPIQYMQHPAHCLEFYHILPHFW